MLSLDKTKTLSRLVRENREYLKAFEKRCLQSFDETQVSYIRFEEDVFWTLG